MLSLGAALLALGVVALAVSAQDPLLNPGRAQGTGSLSARMVLQPLPDGRTYRMHTFRVSLAHARLEVVDLRMSRALDEVLRSRGASLVINGGFFGTQGEPEGMVVSGGRLVSPFLSRIGGGIVATSEGVAHLLDAEAPPAADAADFALQCRPRLVVDRAVNIRRDDGNRADRTALCLRDGGRTLDVVVARTDDELGREGPTLFHFARALARSGCEQALNLDGGPSTGAAWREGRRVRFLPPRAPVRHAVAIWLNDGR
jgi:uncharacterized protein YigE (DUF2233 family)